MTNALSYIGREARRYDRDRFLCSLFAPEDAREGLFTILAFNIEIAKIQEMVRDSILGQIRLQWWSDTIARIYNKSSSINSENELVGKLAIVIKKFNLSQALFDQLIDARQKDLFNVPLADEKDLRKYTCETSSALCNILLETLCPANGILSFNEVKAAESVGVAWALTGIIRASAFLARQKRTYIPLTIMEEFGFNNDEFYSQRVSNGISNAISRIVDLARIEIAYSRNLLKGQVNRRYIALLLQASLAELYLNKIESLKFNPFSPNIENGRLSRQLKIATMAARGAF